MSDDLYQGERVTISRYAGPDDGQGGHRARFQIMAMHPDDRDRLWIVLTLDGLRELADALDGLAALDCAYCGATRTEPHARWCQGEGVAARPA